MRRAAGVSTVAQQNLAFFAPAPELGSSFPASAACSQKWLAFRSSVSNSSVTSPRPAQELRLRDRARAGHAHDHGAVAQSCENPVNRLGMARSF
jgi:hypothetical protein